MRVTSRKKWLKRGSLTHVLLRQNLVSAGEREHPGLGGDRATRWKEPGSPSPNQRHHQMLETEINLLC